MKTIVFLFVFTASFSLGYSQNFLPGEKVFDNVSFPQRPADSCLIIDDYDLGLDNPDSSLVDTCLCRKIRPTFPYCSYVFRWFGLILPDSSTYTPLLADTTIIDTNYTAVYPSFPLVRTALQQISQKFGPYTMRRMHPTRENFQWYAIYFHNYQRFNDVYSFLKDSLVYDLKPDFRNSIAILLSATYTEKDKSSVFLGTFKSEIDLKKIIPENEIEYDLSIYDISGKIIFNSKYPYAEKLSLSQFAQGLYYIRVSYKNKTQMFSFILEK
jgi:hypothetical protein